MNTYNQLNKTIPEYDEKEKEHMRTKTRKKN